MLKNYRQKERYIRNAVRGKKVLGIRTTNIRNKGKKGKERKEGQGDKRD